MSKDTIQGGSIVECMNAQIAEIERISDYAEKLLTEIDSLHNLLFWKINCFENVIRLLGR